MIKILKSKIRFSLHKMRHIPGCQDTHIGFNTFLGKGWAPHLNLKQQL